MPATKCPHCDVMLRAAEATGKRCPVCRGKLDGRRRSQPTTQGHLSRPLGDPLLVMRRWVVGLSLFVIAVAVGCLLFLFLASTPTDPTMEIEYQLWARIAASISAQWAIVVAVAGWPVVALLLVILPRRPSNVLYLRAFQGDPRSLPLRVELQRAFGGRYRMSGIRDPRRRRSIFDYVGFLVFVCRYASPKYMDLEAGSDWKKRLWRSLHDVRLVVLDLTTITDAVREEVELSVSAIGLDRCLFVGDDSRTREEWRTTLGEMLPPGTNAEDAHLLVWTGTDRASRRRFREEARAALASVPADRAIVASSSFQLTTSGTEVRPVASFGPMDALTCLVLVPLLTPFLVRAVADWLPGDEFWWRFSIDLARDTTAFVFLVQFLLYCGSYRKRVLVLAVFAVAIAWYAGLIWLILAERALLK